MNYKVSTIVLSLTLLVLVILLIQHNNKQLYIDEELKTEFAKKKGSLTANDGDIISGQEGKDKLTEFIDNRRGNIFHNFKKSTYGYYFGLNKLKEFVELIDTMNVHIGEDGYPNQKLIGIRVYRAISLNEKTNKKYFDVLMVPVKQDGINFPKIDYNHDPKILIEGGSVLNTSWPCPNQCDQ